MTPSPPCPYEITNSLQQQQRGGGGVVPILCTHIIFSPDFILIIFLLCSV